MVVGTNTVCVVVVVPSFIVTRYSVIGLPPSVAGALHESATCPMPGVAFRLWGTEGTAKGVTVAGGSDAGPVPTAFVAVTVIL